MVQEDVLKRVGKSLDVLVLCTSPTFSIEVDWRINSLNKACGDAYRVHYECLDNHNQQYKDCRPAERGLNYCVMNRIVSTLSRDWRLT